MERLRPTPVLLLLVSTALLGAPSVADAAAVEVTTGALRVDVPPNETQGSHVATGALVGQFPGGVTIVGLFGPISPSRLTVGPGCSQVETTNLGLNRPPGMATSVPALAATCDLTGAVGVRGKLLASDNSQSWFSSLAMPTRISAEGSTGLPGHPIPGDTIVTGPAGDTINAADGRDDIDAGGAPFKGQEFFPGTTGEFEDLHRNTVNAGAGDDTIRLNAGTGRDIVSGGTGVDGVTYASRFPTIGLTGQAGVNVSLNDLDDDGDPSIDPPGSDVGEHDNVKSDVENVTGTKREDILRGNSSPNVLEGGEGKDTLTGLAGVDAIKARETPSANVGTKDTISCGAPIQQFPPQTFMGRSIGSTSPGDSLDFDLADVAPSDCEVLTQGAVKEGPNVVVATTARRAARGRRLRVRLQCPRAAGRTCAGKLRLAARTGRGGPKAAFSIRQGRAKAVTVALPAGPALGARRTTVRLVAVERGRHGQVTTVAFARVRT